MSAVRNGVRLVQSRFADDASTLAKVPPQRWSLPLAVGPVSGAARYLLLQGTGDVALPPPLLVNKGQTSYARIHYAGETLNELAAHMAALEPADQLGLLNDARALGFALEAPPHDLLTLAAGVSGAANPIVWDRLLEVLAELDRHYDDLPMQLAFRRFVIDLLAPLVTRLGSDEAPAEPANVAILRAHLEETLGRFGDAATLAKARERLVHGDGTSPTQHRTALSIVAAQAEPQGFDGLLALARQTKDPLEKQQWYRALAGVLDPTLARRMIDIALSEEVPAGSGPGLIGRLARWHPDLVWDALSPRLEDPQLPWSKTIRWSIVREVAAQSARSQRIADLEAYEARAVPPEARAPFLESVASIRQNQRITSSVLPELTAGSQRNRPPRARRPAAALRRTEPSG